VNRSRTSLIVAVTLVVGVIAVFAACGDDDSGSASTSAPGAASPTGSASTDAPGASPSASSSAPAASTPAAGSIDPLEATVTVDGQPLPTLEDPTDDPAVGMPAPALHGTDYAGEPVDIVPGSGGPMLIVFLAHWCPHCNAEVPRLLEWKDSGAVPPELQVFGVSTGVNPDYPNYPPGQWLKDKGWTWPVLADDVQSSAATAYGLPGYPMFTLVDADGNVVARNSGEIPIDDLNALIASVL
jgi:cytochrome c biogenesis protein CcmG/thiol:disulfide interchange protein DsbE